MSGSLRIAAQQPAVGVRVGAHTAIAVRRQGLQFGHERAVRVEQFFGRVALQPALEQLQARRVAPNVGEGHLVRPPRAFDLVPLDFLRPRPSLGRAQHDHRPARTERIVGLAGALLVRTDLADGALQCRRHLLVHLGRVVAFDEIRRVAVADEQRFELLVADSRQHRGIRDLVAVQVQNRQHGAVADGVDELVRMPRGGERSRLGLAVPHDAGDDQIGVVERHAVGVREAVAELAALMDGPWRLRRHVAADVARKRELLEEPLQAVRVLALVRVDLRVRAFEISRSQDARRAMAGTSHEHDVEIVLHDQPVEMDPDERQRRARAPVAEQPRLHVLDLHRLSEQRVVLQVDHADRQVVAGTPIGVRQLQLAIRQRLLRRLVHERRLRG